jgi:hypothetical protein
MPLCSLPFTSTPLNCPVMLQIIKTDLKILAFISVFLVPIIIIVVWDVDIRYDNHVYYNKYAFRTDTSDEVTKKGHLSRASVAAS